MRKDIWADGLTSNQVYEVIKDRSDWQNNIRRDAAVLKEATDARHSGNLEVNL